MRGTPSGWSEPSTPTWRSGWCRPTLRASAGSGTPPQRQLKDVTILDVFGNAASVKVVASDWVDYMHIVKFNGR